MEFFRIIKLTTTEHDLQKNLRLSNMNSFITEMFNLVEPGETETKVGCIWGEFTLSRSEIKGGVRFALTDCPNALCWTITTGYPPDRDAIVVHLTINRQRKQEKFVEEIHEFLDDMSESLKHFFIKRQG
jgi:hypothetical protein